eukprot:TRINITY_DN1030_c0_g1_i1.p3 TRINITY_DN1030_c0_g1~~TRINITY_DN1030_c0_g1_i1.p3  ORF type:complete len:189 (+),score=15.40 TRINITY_DN1030_c0_g1_i1:957-1523(+)
MKTVLFLSFCVLLLCGVEGLDYYYKYMEHLPCPPKATSIGNTLHEEQRLEPDQALRSSNGAYYAVMQPDGNFVVYMSDQFYPQNAIWSTERANKVVESGGWFSSDTFLYRCKTYLAMQKDGNLVLYYHTSPNSVSLYATWAAGNVMNGKRPFRLVMQDDGNLVLYDAYNSAKWSSGTYRGQQLHNHLL